MQELLSQDPSFGLRQVTKPAAVPAPAAAATATGRQQREPVKRPSDEVIY